MRIVGQIQFWRSCKIVFFWEAVWLFSIFFYFFSSSLFLLLFPQLGAAPAPTSPPSPSSSPKKHWIFERGHTVWGRGVSRLVVIALRIFFLIHATTLSVNIKKSQKTYFVFSLIPIYHMSSKFIDYTDHRIFVQSGSTVCLCLFGNT